MIRKDGIRFPVALKIEDFEKQLPKEKFIRVSNNMIVNIDTILELKYQSNIPVLKLSAPLIFDFKVERNFIESFNSWMLNQSN